MHQSVRRYILSSTEVINLFLISHICRAKITFMRHVTRMKSKETLYILYLHPFFNNTYEKSLILERIVHQPISILSLI